MQRARSALPLQFLPRPVRDRSRYYENFLLQNPTTRASRKDERMAPLRRPYRVIYLGPPEARRSEQRQRWCFQNADSPLLRDGIHFSYNTTLLPSSSSSPSSTLAFPDSPLRFSPSGWYRCLCSVLGQTVLSIGRTTTTEATPHSRKGDTLKILVTLHQLQNHRRLNIGYLALFSRFAPTDTTRRQREGSHNQVEKGTRSDRVSGLSMLAWSHRDS